jgi:hypothetical protein
MESSERVQGSQKNIDSELQELVFWVEKQDAELGITLLVKGLVVFGVMISGKSYFEGLAETVANASGDQESRELARARFINKGEEYRLIVEESNNYRDLVYIHLKDAQFPAVLKIIRDSSNFWRIKIEEVDGFSIGFPIMLEDL